ncbi:unnamed protein product [Hymenolepis diminuta]|uniref:Uncharacterized protein n=1 Tax=Hymenolepis diminuta TaxID=6216 RepID=A0A0R3SYT4_HYMDI|nr:unnamed protein product [Hymenolepis diminuta]
MSCVTYYLCLLLNLVLTGALLGAGIYIFIKEQCWPDKYTKGSCIVGMSLGGLGIVVLVGALLITCIIQCTSRRGAKKGDEEKQADGAAKLANDDLVKPKKDEKPTPSGDERVKSSEGQPKAGDRAPAAPATSTSA